MFAQSYRNFVTPRRTSGVRGETFTSIKESHCLTRLCLFGNVTSQCYSAIQCWASMKLHETGEMLPQGGRYAAWLTALTPNGYTWKSDDMISQLFIGHLDMWSILYTEMNLDIQSVEKSQNRQNGHTWFSSDSDDI